MRTSSLNPATDSPASQSASADAHPVSPAPPEAMTLDASALAGLRDLDPQGRNGLVQRVVKAFRESLARQLPQLRSALAAGDTNAIRNVAHTLKSSSASIGALRLSALCAELEAAVRSGQLDGLQARALRVCAEIENVQPSLDELTTTPPR
jgi:HPt (histidine-containing phosphotransfer) domain-containing protein